MFSVDESNQSLIEHIPDPQTVRERLAQNLRDAQLLRQLLKLAQRVQQDRLDRKGVADAR